MDAATLREIQAPLKQCYRDDPATALTPLQARGGFTDSAITYTVQGWAGRARRVAPGHRWGGTDPCSGDMLERLAALTERYCVVGQTLREPPRIIVGRTGG